MLLRYLVPIALAMFVGGYIEFSDRVRGYSPVNGKADGIVVLTGGTNRLDQGIALLQAGKAPQLLISGVHPDVSDSELLKTLNAWPHPDCCIVIGRQAADTVGNAREAGRWARSEGLTSLHIVTSAYHLPRAMLEFTRHLPPSIRLYAQPVLTDRVRLDHWWRPTGSSALLLTEYSKFIIGSLRLALLGKSQIEAGILPSRLNMQP